jgi:hypothetical protein
VSSSSVHVIDVCLSYINVEAKNIQLMVKAKNNICQKKVKGKKIVPTEGSNSGGQE